MTYHRILLAVDDSPAGLAAAQAAVDLAADQGAALRAVHVLGDHGLEQALGPDGVLERRDLAGAAVLAWVAGLAESRDVACETVAREGEPFRRILDEASAWPADLLVLGRSDRRGPSSPYVGSETEHVLEFSDLPVLVVPGAADDGWRPPLSAP